MAMQTQTQVREEPPYIRINPVTGHTMNVDEDTAENIRQALGSDHADPPDEQNMSIPHWQFQVPGNTSQQPFHPPPQPPPRRPEGGGGGGGRGRGRGRGGGRGGGGGGGGLPAPAGPGLFPPHGRAPDTKFLGSEPEAFTGDRTKVESFLMQWELYCGVNAKQRRNTEPIPKDDVVPHLHQR
jgi:hypothetical protein